MAEALSREGFDVLKAIDAPSALRAIEKHTPIDLLVTDISLPGINGCELARQILDIQPDAKVLFVSGFVGAEVCQYYGVPITDLFFLRKPFTPRDLVARVELVLQAPGRVQLSAPASGGAA